MKSNTCVRWSLTLVSLAVLLALRPRPGTAQNAGVGGKRPTVAGTKITMAPVIDGKLDEAVWSQAKPLTGFIQREPHTGDAISERTEVRFLTDGDALYIGAWLYDRDATAIVPGEKTRDADLANSDYFAIILDTYLDRQNGFVFATTPSGVEYDGQVVKEGEGGGVQGSQTRAQAGALGGFNLNWDGTWRVATSIDSLGWYAEFRIPFSTLRYGGAKVQSWGLNAARSIRRRNEEAFWAPIPSQYNLYRLSQAGTLEGLEVPTRRTATLTPYVLGSIKRDFVLGHGVEYPREVGADAKIGVSPSLTLDLTYNTDFAQVEVDEVRTNLTRFPLFFPEKRPFFLENAGVFSAGTPQAVDLFFTRRIGIDTLGQPVPILGGGRLTGRVAGASVGLLEIVTDRSGGQRPTSYSVGRVSKELKGRSRFGAIVVQRIATDDGADHNRTYGVDGRVGFGDDWTLDWWGAKTETPRLTGDDLGYSVRLAQSNRTWNSSARVVSVGRDFNPEVGFLNRFGGYRFYEGQVVRYIRDPSKKWLRYYLPHLTYRGYFDPRGTYSSAFYHIDPEMEFTNGGRFGPELNIYHERLTQPFVIAKGDTLPVGSYNYVQMGLDLATNPSAPLSLVVRGDYGPFYNGSLFGTTLTMTARKGASVTTSLVVDYQDVHLKQGDFTRVLLGWRLGYFFTPRIFVQSLTQYSNQARTWSANVRFGWLNTAGTGLYVVLNGGQEAEGVFRWIRPQTRSFVVKYTRQFGS
ncbi:MAG: DUF5916 domain-containing protein [Gemmatimonadota bacterium]